MSAHANRHYWTPGRVVDLLEGADDLAEHPLGHIPEGIGPGQPVLQRSESGALFVAVYDDASGWMHMPVPANYSPNSRGRAS